MIYLVETPSGDMYFSTLPDYAIEEDYRTCGEGDFIIAAIDEEKGTSPEALGDFARKTVEFFSCCHCGLHLTFMEDSIVGEIIEEAKTIGDDFSHSIEVAMREANRIDCYDLTENAVQTYEDFSTTALRNAYAEEVFRNLKDGKFMLVGVE